MIARTRVEIIGRCLPAESGKICTLSCTSGYPTVWDSYEEIVDACAEAWNWLMADPHRIRSIGTREWATVNV